MHARFGRIGRTQILMGALLAPAVAQDGPVLVEYEAEAASSVATGTDRFGHCVAVDGDRMIVGAPWLDLGSIRPGLAFVLERTGEQWQETAILSNLPQSDLDKFGESVDIEGDVAAVGAPWVGPGSVHYGEVWVFEHEAGAWAPTARIQGIAQVPLAADFGRAVCLRGDRLFVGAPHGNGGGGGVYIYERLGNQWLLDTVLGDPDSSWHPEFGYSLAVSDAGLLVVGARYHGQGQGYYRAGKVFVFREDANGWNVDGELIGEPGGPSFRLGWSVAIDGERVVAGAPHIDGGGLAFLFERAGGSWVQRERLKAGSSEGSDQYGWSVALRGETALVGAPYRLDYGESYVFRSYGGDWGAAATLTHPPAVQSGSFGSAVARDGERLYVGAAWAGAAGGGRVYVHRYEDALTIYCAGDGSGAACPCGNAGPAGAGCRNSTGAGATLTGSGTASTLADDLMLHGAGLPPQQAALLFVGEDPIAGGAGLPFGGGLLCVDTNIVRLAVRSVGPSGGVAFGPDLGALGGWSAGDLRYFQLWYRDPAAGPCGGGFNLSVGVAAEFAN